MKKFYTIGLCVLSMMVVMACTDKNDNLAPVIQPEARGTFVDGRDGFEYQWVRYNGLDWTVENAQFDTKNSTNCTVYQPYGWSSSQPRSTANKDRYGYLYTKAGAKMAVPEGWRLPTDEDWKVLEMALGTSSEQADAKEWRGTHAGDLMKYTNTEAGLDIRMGGYFTPYTIMSTTGYRFMGSYAFFWTDTKDESKEGEYYFYRKLLYNKGQVYRESMEPNKAMLSVRFVRDAAN